MICAKHLCHYPQTPLDDFSRFRMIIATDSRNSRLCCPPDDHSLDTKTLHAIDWSCAILAIEVRAPSDNFEICHFPVLAVSQFHNMLSRIATMVSRTYNPKLSPRVQAVLVCVDNSPEKNENSQKHSALGGIELSLVTSSWLQFRQNCRAWPYDSHAIRVLSINCPEFRHRKVPSRAVRSRI
jgi:hypothetical protein